MTEDINTPEELLWSLYAAHVAGHLSAAGMPPGEARGHVIGRTPEARAVLEKIKASQCIFRAVFLG